MSKKDKKAAKADDPAKVAKTKKTKSAALSPGARQRAELKALRLLVGRMLLVQARNMGKETYLKDLQNSLRQDLDSSLPDDADPEIRAAMDAVIDGLLDQVRLQLLLARADGNKRN
ncbi:MAG: hypothetical protein Kilf2KO_02870 [Rhodospirillales bacterium]